MFAAIPVALVTLALSFAVSAAPAPVSRRGESDWAWGYLENYDTYHTRYEALDCEDQHDTSFFDQCCHPLLASQSLSDRPSYCTPSSSSDDSSSSGSGSSNVAATPASSSDDSSSSSSDPPSAAATPASSSDDSSSSSSGSSDDSSSSSGSSSSAVTGGFATYFYQGGNAGACGTVHSDSDYIAAIDIAYYGNTGDVSSWCGKSLLVENTDTGATVTVTVADVCPTCDNSASLDLSVGAFEALGSLSQGLLNIEYWVQ